MNWQKTRLQEFARSLPAKYKVRLRLGLAMTFVCMMELFTIETIFLMSRDSPYMQVETLQWDHLNRIAFVCGLCIHLAAAYLVYAWRNPVVALRHRFFSVGGILMTPIVASFFAGEPSLVFSLTAMTTKIGNFRAKEVTLTEAGCQVIASLDHNPCVKASDGANKLCNVHVMSRIGSESYLLLSYARKVSATIGTKLPSASIRNSGNGSTLKQPRLDGKSAIQDIYIPTKDILGIKPDTSIRNFTKDAMRVQLGKTVSECSETTPTSVQPHPDQKHQEGRMEWVGVASPRVALAQPSF
jgi:hypothetical protein